MDREITHVYEFGPFRLDPSEHLLLRDGRPVPLAPKAFETLVVLVERGGRLVEKEELLRLVWADACVEEANLARCVHTLRKALGEGSDGRKFIETISKHGYRFVAPVHELERGGVEVAAADFKSAGEAVAVTVGAGEVARPSLPRAAHGPTPLRLRRRLSRPALILLALVAAAVVVGVYFYSDRGQPPAINSVAVLPFAHASDDPEVEYLSDGLSESLINALSQTPHLKVIASSSVFKYKGRETDPREVAQALGVRAIVTGRVVKRGDDLLIGVELVDGRNRTQMWGAQYSRRSSDLQALRSEIAGEIVKGLHVQLTATEQRQLARRETVIAQAYELLLRGRFYWRRGGTENRKMAVEYFQQAVAADPSYAAAYAELSFAYSSLITASVLDPKEFTPRAEAAALKALELDEGLAEAHHAMAGVKLLTWEWAAAERSFKRAIELKPNDVRARNSYSFYLSLMGRHEQAIVEAGRTREIDPLSPSVYSSLATMFLLARRNDEALEASRKALELAPDSPIPHVQTGYAYAAKGQYREAIAAYLEGIRRGDETPDTQVYLGAAYAKAGEREKAREILRRLTTGRDYISPGTLAALYVALGEHERALASLERAYAIHDNQLQFLAVDPNLDPLRPDPRFQDLVRRVGLPQ